MSEQDRVAKADLEAATSRIQEATLNAMWRQWAAIGASAAGGRARAVVDPEALLLASLWFTDEEPRLMDLVASWVVENVAHLSVQRAKNVARSFPEVVERRLPALARLALERGKDFRWKSLVRSDVPPLAERRGGKKLSVPVPLQRPAALMVRMRVLLGVGMRTDIITFLLTVRDGYIAPDDVAAATAYNLASVRRVLAQLAEAGGLNYAAGTYPGYSIRGSPLQTAHDLRVAEIRNAKRIAREVSPAAA